MNFFRIITCHPSIIYKRAIFFHKKYYNAKANKNILSCFLWGTIANYYARKYNLELYGKFGDGMTIYHGNIVINGEAVLGKNVIFHGNNCVGNRGNEKAPVIGDGVELGYGAIILGDIRIADNVIVGAGAVVLESINEKGAIVAGIPAKIIKRL